MKHIVDDQECLILPDINGNQCIIPLISLYEGRDAGMCGTSEEAVSFLIEQFRKQCEIHGNQSRFTYCMYDYDELRKIKKG